MAVMRCEARSAHEKQTAWREVLRLALESLARMRRAKESAACSFAGWARRKTQKRDDEVGGGQSAK